MPLSLENLGPHIKHGSLGPPESVSENGISVGSAVLAQLTGNDSLPKIITNNTINLFIKTAITISILVISDRNNFRLLFDKIASVYLYLKKTYLHFSSGNGQPREPALCQLYRHTFVPERQAAGRIQEFALGGRPLSPFLPFLPLRSRIPLKPNKGSVGALLGPGCSPGRKRICCTLKLRESDWWQSSGVF